ncbi:uncharacterized protein LOC108597129 isoform X2 [Drosophila busckii]|uniref:uncharacterized protein LOC108597129 isoform X2 n=1 Tax=Drosophila busckii TaxID=30019 RepID=UPI00083EA3B2|nr:uncharacterized protein LOC108597129 isoform X2 [Drosophila busckii]
MPNLSKCDKLNKYATALIGIVSELIGGFSLYLSCQDYMQTELSVHIVLFFGTIYQIVTSLCLTIGALWMQEKLLIPWLILPVSAIDYAVVMYKVCNGTIYGILFGFWK